MASKKQLKLKSEAHSKNIEKRGKVPESLAKTKSDDSNLGPVLLAFFLFVVVGSALFQALQVIAK